MLQGRAMANWGPSRARRYHERTKHSVESVRAGRNCSTGGTGPTRSRSTPASSRCRCAATRPGPRCPRSRRWRPAARRPRPSSPCPILPGYCAGAPGSSARGRFPAGETYHFRRRSQQAGAQPGVVRPPSGRGRGGHCAGGACAEPAGGADPCRAARGRRARERARAGGPVDRRAVLARPALRRRRQPGAGDPAPRPGPRAAGPGARVDGVRRDE